MRLGVGRVGLDATWGWKGGVRFDFELEGWS